MRKRRLIIVVSLCLTALVLRLMVLSIVVLYEDLTQRDSLRHFPLPILQTNKGFVATALGNRGEAIQIPGHGQPVWRPPEGQMPDYSDLGVARSGVQCNEIVAFLRGRYSDGARVEPRKATQKERILGRLLSAIWSKWSSELDQKSLIALATPELVSPAFVRENPRVAPALWEEYLLSSRNTVQMSSYTRQYIEISNVLYIPGYLLRVLHRGKMWNEVRRRCIYVFLFDAPLLPPFGLFDILFAHQSWHVQVV